ncbi:MAG: hypothetical protein E7426_06000 [Ruminococcaceae bacterium]|jgi:hypothetical protein|nr:hypothetical protein [Oscillospiraceae bacterium]
MKFLNLFPIPKKYERVISVLTFAATAALVVVLIRERTTTAVILATFSALILAVNQWIRYQQKKEAAVFFTQENERLMEVRGKNGPAHYIRERLPALSSIRHPDVRLAAQLNMSTVMLAGMDTEGAGKVLGDIDPKRIDDTSLLLVYWTQSLLAAIQAGDDQRAAEAYQTAGTLIPEVHEALQNSFKPACIQYLLYCEESDAAMEMLDEIDLEELDRSSTDQINALSAYALLLDGREAEARALAGEVRLHNVLPSTAWWLDKVLRAEG